ncbi:MAG: aldo/keto reductase [Planctomycetota bacterium]
MTTADLTSDTRRRPLGREGPPVAPIAYGAVKIGRNQGLKLSPFELPTEAQASQLLNGLLDVGVNLIDTAPAYGLSEQRIGAAIAHRRDDFVLSTKVGERFEDGCSAFDFSYDGVLSSLDTSRKRLRSDVIDLVLIHSDGNDQAIQNEGACVEALQEARQRGWVKQIGLSGKTVGGARQALAWADVLMIPLSPDDTSHLPVAAEAAEHGVGVLVKKGLGSGRLSAEQAIPWLMQQPGVTAAVVGSLSIEHMAENLRLARAAMKTQAVHRQTPSQPRPVGRVVMVSYADRAAGAERAALALHKGLLAEGTDSRLIVDRQMDPSTPATHALDPAADRNPWTAWCESQSRRAASQGRPRLGKLWRTAGRPGWLAQRPLDLGHPGTRKIEQRVDPPADLVHLHNLENWFDYRDLPRLCHAVPVCLTLHDQALLHGYGSYAQDGAITAENADPYPRARRRKQALWARSRLHVCAPSQWMLDAAYASILGPAIASAVRIPYGIELDVFRPASLEQRAAARAKFDLPANAHVMLFCAHRARSHPHKRLADAWAAAKQTAFQTPDTHHVLLVLGDDGPSESAGAAHLRFLGQLEETSDLARAYHAADLLLHTAVRDNFPFAVLEALGCGLPVVARSVGGVAEQFDDGEQGRLVDPNTPGELVSALRSVLQNEAQRKDMARAARQLAEARYNLPAMVQRTLSWYRAAQSDFASVHGDPAGAGR